MFEFWHGLCIDCSTKCGTAPLSVLMLLLQANASQILNSQILNCFFAVTGNSPVLDIVLSQFTFALQIFSQHSQG